MADICVHCDRWAACWCGKILSAFEVLCYWFNGWQRDIPPASTTSRQCLGSWIPDWLVGQILPGRVTNESVVKQGALMRCTFRASFGPYVCN